MWLTFALISVFFVSTSALLEKKALTKEHALEFSATLSVYSFLLSVPLFLVFNTGTYTIPVVPLCIIALVAVIGAAAFVLVMTSFRHMEVSEISPFIAVGPAVTGLFGFIFLGELLTSVQVLGMVVIVLGIYFLELKSPKDMFSPFKAIYKNIYIHYILLSLVLYAICDVLGKYALTAYDISPIQYLFYFQMFLAIFFLAWIHIKKRHGIAIHISKENAGLICIIALLTLSHRFTHISAMQLTSIGIAVAIHRSSTLITTLVGGKIYKEGHLIHKGIAAVAVICGVVLIAM
ncbi:MAG: DMT family transporter [Patescibacteria group bacterium]